MTNLQIQKAKEVDLRDIIYKLEIPYEQASDHVKIRCIWHEELNPSLAIYSDHFHCFGCNIHGDQIDFIQKIYNCGFKNAVRFLNSYEKNN